MEEIEEHLIPLRCGCANSTSDESSSDDDSCVEVCSNIDESEMELIEWTNYLQRDSADDCASDHESQSVEPLTLVDYSSSEDSSDNEGNSHYSHENTSAIFCHKDPTSTSSSSTGIKRKRRQWTTNEKLHAIKCFEKNNNKNQTAKQIGCATKQLRSWIKKKKELLELSSQRKGN